MKSSEIRQQPANLAAAAAAAKSLQSCPTLCDPIDGSPPGSPVLGILQARTLEWVAVSFSNAWKWKVKVKSLSRVRLFTIPWTAAYQAPPSMGFSRQECWSGVPLPSPQLILETHNWVQASWYQINLVQTRKRGQVSQTQITDLKNHELNNLILHFYFLLDVVNAYPILKTCSYYSPYVKSF